MNKEAPKEGTFTAWKAVRGNYLLKLEIPKDARRHTGDFNKCRAEYVRTLEAYTVFILGIESFKEDRYGNYIYSIEYQTKTSIYSDDPDKLFISQAHGIYKIGEITKADKWSDKDLKTCTNGIHFFMDSTDAIRWGINQLAWNSVLSRNVGADISDWFRDIKRPNQ